MQRLFSSRITVVVYLIGILGAYAFLHGAHVPEYFSHSENVFQGEPLLTTPDGYFYLRQAEDVYSGTYETYDSLRDLSRPVPAPLLATMLATFSSLTNVPLLTSAFYFSPVLAALLLVSMGCWGVSIGRTYVGLTAGLVASCSHIWFSRVMIGTFDTDALILPLLLFALIPFSRPLRGSAIRLCWGVAVSFLALGILKLWWPQGALVMTGLVVAMYAASVVLPEQGRYERLLKAALCIVGAMLFAYVLWGNPEGALGRVAAFVRAHVNLALKTQPSIFTETGETVTELVTLSFSDTIREVAGHWSVAICSIVGFAVFVWRHRWSAFVVGGPLVLLGMAAIGAGNRFLLFWAPCFGLGIVVFVYDVMRPLLQRVHRRCILIVHLLPLLLLAPSALYCLSATPPAVHDANAVSLASVIRQKTPPDSFIWNWWGPGYMQQYFGRRRTLVDGGKQQPEPVFIASVPFATNDPLLARNWIKFFSVHRYGLAELAKWVGGKAEAVAFLQALFAHPESLESMLARHPFPQDRAWDTWFFPEQEVYMILHTEMLVRSTWNSLGRWDPVTQEHEKVTVHMTPVSQVQLNRKQGVAIDKEGNAVEYAKLYFVHPQRLSHDPVRAKGPVAMLFWQSPYFYTLQQTHFDCLAYRLLFIYPNTTPGFEPVVFNPYVGGLWRVH